MRRGVIVLVVLVIAVSAAVALSIRPLSDPQNGISLGLDLRGGVHLVLQAEQNENGDPTARRRCTAGCRSAGRRGTGRGTAGTAATAGKQCNNKDAYGQ